ncbi:unnamed protein product [Lactuca saligna]|uniref:Uncharacterized protein n=1 Tax=Lactuca saligna TaxID=75948 RepID=A0AA35YHC5_LACSI|nr:unnamed protein product [Lactuca saligna]
MANYSAFAFVSYPSPLSHQTKNKNKTKLEEFLPNSHLRLQSTQIVNNGGDVSFYLSSPYGKWKIHISLLLWCSTLYSTFINSSLYISLKTIYFVESWKLVKRLFKYVLYKGTFLAAVVPLTLPHAGLWFTWLTIVCTLKMFEALAS